MKRLTAIVVSALVATAAIVTVGTAGTSQAQEKGSGSGAGSGSGKNMKAKAGKGSGSGSGTGMAIKGDTGPSSRAFNDANMAMHKDMAITYTGDTDVDFARGMIPHHKGAIEMAKIQLQYGKDPELRKLAEEIVKAQDTEIAFMNEWLKKKGK